MPIAQTDVVSTAPNTPVNIFVLDNDSGNQINIVGLLNPAFGTVALNSDSSITYTPNPDFQGEDSFFYTIRDDLGQTDQGLVMITVALGNTPPVAVDDFLPVTAGTPANIDLLANDRDDDDDLVQIFALTSAAHGTVTINRDLTVRYEAQNGYIGADSFSYSISDGRGGIDSATVNVLVSPANNDPVANDDVVATVKNAAVTFNPLDNDTDLDGDDIRFSGLVLPVNGTLIVNGDMTITYTPNSNFVGGDNFSYQITDGNGGFSSAFIQINVADQNTDPVAADDTTEALVNQSVVIDVVGNDSDIDLDSLTVTSFSMPSNGTVSANSGTTLSYTPNVGFIGNDSFTYTVSDNRGGEDTATVNIVVADDPNRTTFINGYNFRRSIIVPNTVVSGDNSLVNYPLLVKETGDWLKSTGNGGRIENSGFLDIRFETAAGQKLDHEIEKFDGVAGELIAWISLPNLSNTANTAVYLYYGKSSVPFEESRTHRVWRDYLAVYHLPDGMDKTGNNRNLAASNVGTGGLIGDAGSFNGSSSTLSLPDATWLNGLSGFTAQAWINSTAVATDKGFIAVGSVNGLDSGLGFGIRYDAQGFIGGGTNVVTVEQQHTDGRSRLESSNDVQTTQNQSVYLTWQSGELTSLHIDGALSLPTSQSTVPRSGPTDFANGPLTIGTGARDTNNGGWSGLIDEVRFSATGLSTDWIQTEYLNHADPALFYGLGGENAFGDTIIPPIALPESIETDQDAAITFDVLANDVSDPANPNLTITNLTSPNNGTATESNGQITYTPNSEFSGDDSFFYTITNASGRESRAKVLVKVNEIAGGQQNQDLPYFGEFYGFAPFGHGFADTRLIVSTDMGVSNFFYASRNGFVDACRFHRRTGTGYSDGDGGRYTIRIVEADEATKLPLASGRIMSETTGYLPGNTDQPRFPNVALTPFHALEAKKPYCFVWINTHPDPLNNHFAQNSDVVYQWNNPVPAQTLSAQPSDFPGEDFWTPATFTDNGVEKTLFPYPITYFNGRPRWHRCGPPLIDFRYTDGQWGGWASWGSPYITPGYLITFTQTKHIRERFRVSRATRTVSSVWLNIWRLNGGTGNLILTLESGPNALETGTGTIIEQVNVPASQIYDAGASFERDTNRSDPDLVPWLEVPFSQNHVLQLGQVYSIRLRTAGGTMETTASTRGEFQGLSPRHFDFDTHESNRTLSWHTFDDSMGMQQSTNSGTNWVWAGNRRQMPCLFKCV